MNIILCSTKTVLVVYGQFCGIKYCLMNELCKFEVLSDIVYTINLSVDCSTQMLKVQLLERTVTLAVETP